MALPAHPGTHDLALDVSPSAEAVTELRRSPEGAEQIVLQEGPAGRPHASDSRAYRVASLAVLPALDFVCCRPDSAHSPGHCQKQPLDAEPRPSEVTAPLSNRLLHFEPQVADLLMTNPGKAGPGSGQHRPRGRRVRRRDLLLGVVLPTCGSRPTKGSVHLHGRLLEPPDYSRQGRARGWAVFKYKRVRHPRRRKQGPPFQHQLARCGHFCPSPWSAGVANRGDGAFLSSSLGALHRSLLILLLCILFALVLELRRRLRSSSHIAVERSAPDAQVQRVHKTTDSKASHALSCPGPKPGDDSPSQQQYRHQDIRWQRYLLYWAIVAVQLQTAGAVGLIEG